MIMENKKESQEQSPSPKLQNKLCSKCGSGQTYVRIKEKSVVCRNCGNIDLMEKQ